jgi:hypothetical protein
MIATTNETMPAEAVAAFREFPAPVRERLERIRALIFDVAGENSVIGPLTETLKWGEPAYLTATTGSGSTIRLGWAKTRPNHAAIYFNCRTALVQTFRDLFPGLFEYSSDRAIFLAVDQPIAENALRLCVRIALTYHTAKVGRRISR